MKTCAKVPNREELFQNINTILAILEGHARNDTKPLKDVLPTLSTHVETLVLFVRACKRGDIATRLMQTLPSKTSRSVKRIATFRGAFGDAMAVLNEWAGCPDDDSEPDMI